MADIRHPDHSHAAQVVGRPLPRNHRCRTDDLNYSDVWAWYQDHVDRIPAQAATALSRHRQQHECSFEEAFTALTAPGGPLVLLGDDG